MIYAIADLHGCYQTYLKALKTINLQDEDTLYVIGDVIDRGPDGIAILEDMSMRYNVIPILGNHEYMALQVLSRLCVEITEENVENHLSEEDIKAYMLWMENGGEPTLRAFQKLSRFDQEGILDYLSEFTLYEEVCAGGRDYVLAHAGFTPFDPDKPLEDYALHEVIFTSNTLEEESMFPFTLICGHTPTMAYGSAYRNQIYRNGSRIDIDCGLVFGNCLAVYCLDNDTVTYIPYEKEGEILE